ncbi:uncharacterized protein DFL_003064 [Arthrobotrys flagrans]|uniref:Uncharacterized protein n=1 Tax=Arthrobotrys flagrans TaxID=97331 RepID=A0A437ADM3_ARTFL|nr:hypothetical protein DFL_003064 [Arthrobotrys flagrans]
MLILLFFLAPPFPPVHAPTHQHLPPRNFTKTPHIPSNNPIDKLKCCRHSKAPPKVPSRAPPIPIPILIPAPTPKGYCLIGGIVMPPYSCSDPSYGPESKAPGYIVEELVFQSSGSAGEGHTPVVHLPENVPPPILLSETGYPMGIAGPDGSPAWAKPTASHRPPKHEHGHEHGRHKNVHRPNHHNHPPAGFQPGPEYLIPMGTPVPNPYSPVFIFLPRIIPCRPVGNPVHIVDYDDLDTIQGDKLSHQGSRTVFEDLNSEYARMKLRAEQDERARIEEIERNQALRNAHQKEYEKKAWLNAMGVKEAQRYVDASSSAHHAAAYDEERVLNIHVRQPCDKCQEPVTIETVHQRFSSHDSTQGIRINLDSPAQKPNEEFLCEECKIAKAEEKKNSDLVRKLVRQVVTEANTIEKAKYNQSSLSITSPRSRGTIHDEYSEPIDPRVALKESLLHHGRKKPTRFENMPEDTDPSNSNLRARHSKHHFHGRTELNMSNVYQDESDSKYPSPKEARVTQSKSRTRLSDRLSRSVLAALDKEHFVNNDNIHIISSKDTEDDGEEEVIVIRRSRRHNDKVKNNGSRSHSTLVKSATEIPKEALEAITRPLANQLGLFPPKADSFYESANLRKNAKGKYQESKSDSDTYGYSAFLRKHQRSTTQTHQRYTYNRINHTGRGTHGHTTTHHEHHRHHRRERIVDDDDENHPNYQRRRHTNPDDDPRGSSNNAAGGFFSGWGLFRKATF